MADVILKLVIDGKEFDAKIKDADKQIGVLKKDVQKHGAEMTTSLKSVAGAMGLAFGAASVLSFMKSSVRAYAEQEAALKKLEVALGRNASGLSDYASELQKVTAFGDETILEGMAMLAMFTKNEDEIKRLTKATLDFAAAKGMDLVSAADLVAKTIGSEVNALGRYGIQVDGAVNSTERLEKTINGLTKLFAGQATAQLDTYVGEMKNLTNRLGDVEEKLGEKIIPLITVTGEALVTGIERWSIAFESFFKKLSGDYTAFMLLLGIDTRDLPSMVSPHQQTEALYKKLGELLISPHQQVLATQKAINKEKEKEVKTARELWDIRKKNMKEEAEYWQDFYNEYMKSLESTSATSKASGKPGELASTPVREMSQTMQESMGVIQDTTNAMWANLIIGGRQAVGPWDAIWLAFRNSALQRIGEIVQNQIWNFLFDTIFSFVPGFGGVSGGASSAVTSLPSSIAGGVNRKMEITVNGKIEGENIVLSYDRTVKRKSDNSL